MSPQRRFKDSAYEQLARIGKSLAAPKRVELLDLLAQGPRTVEALAELSALSVANTSQHLKVLREASLVSREKQGLYGVYRLADAQVSRFVGTLRRLAHARLPELAEVTHAYFETRDTIDPVDGPELLRRVRRGEVTVLDVRPHDEYLHEHIPGARSIPLDELRARLGELSECQEIVAYCRGPYCVMAADAVTLLRKRGFVAHRIDEGVSDWRARGWRVTQGAESA
ncbi:MAG: metalloregulator ArsR/SmtB family transcription factor [Deltaproteobacteria bacterium]|nr:metalloregulator ArsR/SmtB family transcription factor [Deltaproteobacteria bacterium]